jgi:hypothetical protein
MPEGVIVLLSLPQATIEAGRSANRNGRREAMTGVLTQNLGHPAVISAILRADA